MRNGSTFLSLIASTIVYVCSLSPNACSVVRRAADSRRPAFSAKIGVPGEAEQVVALECLGDRGVHVAELAAMALVEDHDDVPAVDLVCPCCRSMKRASFWIVVMMIRAPGSSSCRLSTPVEVFELAAPFSKRSYSRIVW